MSDWEPIETATKDGSYILLYGRHHKRAVATWIVARWDGEDWESSDDGYSAYITPTHWMPVTEPAA